MHLLARDVPSVCHMLVTWVATPLVSGVAFDIPCPAAFAAVLYASNARAAASSFPATSEASSGVAPLANR